MLNKYANANVCTELLCKHNFHYSEL